MVSTNKTLELIDMHQKNEIQREPWEMQIDEEPAHFEAFRVYRDLQPHARRFATVAKAVDKSGTCIASWARKTDWIARAAAWDRHMDAVARQAELDAIQDMKKRHVQISMQLQALGVAELAKLLKRAKRNSGKNLLTAADAAKLVEQGMRLERLNMGEAETVSEDRGAVNWADLVRRSQND